MKIDFKPNAPIPFSPQALQGQVSNKADLQGWSAETWLILASYEAVVIQAQVIPLVGAEGEKCRRRKIAFLVRSEADDESPKIELKFPTWVLRDSSILKFG